MFSNELWNKSGVSTYSIDQSIRFNDDDTAYMTRTPASAGTEETWTYSLWVKRGDINTDSTLLEVHQDANNRFIMYLRDSAQSYNLDVVWRISGTSNVLRTTQSLRDPSAWYHFVLTADTNNLASERLRLYINGSRVTDFSQNDVASSITSGMSLKVNEAILHTIGRYSAGSGFEMDGYLAEIVFIDGTALDPSSFGEYNDSNIWIPKDVSGLTFGTNGFYIKGENASDLGNDSSSNNNDFTTSGLASHDQMTGESPTNNFAVLNPLNLNLTYPAQLSEGNLKMGVISGGFRPATSTIAMNSGKFYAEAISHDTHQNVSFGFRYADLPPNNVVAGQNTGQFGMLLTGQIYDENTLIGTASGVSISGTQRVAIDLDAGKGWLGVDSDFFDSSAGTTGNPSTGANPTFTFTAGRDIYFLFVSYTNLGAATANFGQDGTFAGDVTAGGNTDANGIGNFKESVPTGYLALCTKNLGS